MSECVVYWLHDETCINPSQHGYVGISARFKRRLVEHRLSGKFPEGFQFVILHEGTVDECFEIEQQLRPDHRIGWNNLRGGHHRNHSVGYKHSDETCVKVSASLKGHVVDPATRDKIRRAGLGKRRSLESRAKQSASAKGKPKSDEWKVKASEAAKARYADQKERELAKLYQVGKHDYRKDKTSLWYRRRFGDLKLNKQGDGQ